MYGNHTALAVLSRALEGMSFSNVLLQGACMLSHNLTGTYWGAELCQADSDGDGKTNGEELGDPCCVWQPAALPTVGKDYRISHPGHAQDVTDSPGPSAAECQALVRSQGAAEAFNETEWVDSMYNPGEDRLNATFAYASSKTNSLTSLTWFGLAWVTHCLIVRSLQHIWQPLTTFFLALFVAKAAAPLIPDQTHDHPSLLVRD
jgi:hypothetical protein